MLNNSTTNKRWIELAVLAALLLLLLGIGAYAKVMVCNVHGCFEKHYPPRARRHIHCADVNGRQVCRWVFTNGRN